MTFAEIIELRQNPRVVLEIPMITGTCTEACFEMCIGEKKSSPKFIPHVDAIEIKRACGKDFA